MQWKRNRGVWRTRSVECLLERSDRSSNKSRARPLVFRRMLYVCATQFRSFDSNSGLPSEGLTGRTLLNGATTEGGAAEMTIELCTSACQAAGYTLAGAEYSQECCTRLLHDASSSGTNYEQGVEIQSRMVGHLHPKA